MSQIDNKVKWCINKAKKELEEGKKHRGLIIITPNIDEVTNHIKKAEHNFKAIITFEQTGFGDWSVSALFTQYITAF